MQHLEYWTICQRGYCNGKQIIGRDINIMYCSIIHPYDNKKRLIACQRILELLSIIMLREYKQQFFYWYDPQRNGVIDQAVIALQAFMFVLLIGISYSGYHKLHSFYWKGGMLCNSIDLDILYLTIREWNFGVLK